MRAIHFRRLALAQGLLPEASRSTGTPWPPRDREPAFQADRRRADDEAPKQAALEHWHKSVT
jgi:hypothetical protein